MTERHGERRDHPADEPAPTITSKARSDYLLLNTRQRSLQGGARTVDYKRTTDRPAPTLTAQANGFWQWEKPATTICGDPRITARCHHDNGSQGKNPETTEQVRAGEYDGVEPIKLTIEEALTLQGFPPEFPVVGSRTKQFEQVGNAVPPALAFSIVDALAKTPCTQRFGLHQCIGEPGPNHRHAVEACHRTTASEDVPNGFSTDDKGGSDV